MAYQEGRGYVAPAPLSVTFPNSVIRQLIELSIGQAMYRGYNSKSDRWKKGLLKTDERILNWTISSSALGTYMAKISEEAVAKVINKRLGFQAVRVDHSLRPLGDGDTDLSLGGYRIQVKCRHARTKKNRVRRVDVRKQIRRLNCNAFVFAKWENPGTVHLLGWMEKQHLWNGIFGRSLLAEHWNLEIDDRFLYPMGSFLRQCENEMEAMQWR